LFWSGGQSAGFLTEHAQNDPFQGLVGTDWGGILGIENAETLVSQKQYAIDTTDKGGKIFSCRGKGVAKTAPKGQRGESHGGVFRQSADGGETAKGEGRGVFEIR